MKIGEQTARSVKYEWFKKNCILIPYNFVIRVNYLNVVDDIIDTIEKILSYNYLRRKYIIPSENSLSKIGVEIRKNYGRLVQLQDTFKKERKSRIAQRASNNA